MDVINLSIKLLTNNMYYDCVWKENIYGGDIFGLYHIIKKEKLIASKKYDKKQYNVQEPKRNDNNNDNNNNELKDNDMDIDNDNKDNDILTLELCKRDPVIIGNIATELYNFISNMLGFNDYQIFYSLLKEIIECATKNIKKI